MWEDALEVLRTSTKAGEVAQQIKVQAAKPAHNMVVENQLLPAALGPAHSCSHLHMNKCM